MNSFPFLEMFFEYQPDEPLRAALLQAAVSHAEIDQENKSISLSVLFSEYLPAKDLQEAEQALCGLYGLHRVTIKPQYPASELQKLEGTELSRVLIARYSPAVASLAGCTWELAEGESTLYLRANGKDALLPHLPAAEQYIFERFGVRTQIKIVAGNELDGEALFAETERLRQEAARDLPAVPAATSGGKKAEQPPSMIYGKPFKGAALAMREITLDQQGERVIVEGKIFAVEHREINKRAATVVGFDMTDYTSSVRISDFMKGDTAKPITDAIQKPGMWVRVQGKVDYDNYAKELVIRPYAICRMDAQAGGNRARKARRAASAHDHVHDGRADQDRRGRRHRCPLGAQGDCDHRPRRRLFLPRRAQGE